MSCHIKDVSFEISKSSINLRAPSKIICHDKKLKGQLANPIKVKGQDKPNYVTHGTATETNIVLPSKGLPKFSSFYKLQCSILSSHLVLSSLNIISSHFFLNPCLKTSLTFRLELVFESPFLFSLDPTFPHQSLSITLCPQIMEVSSEAKAEISVPVKWHDMKDNAASKRSIVWMEPKPVKKLEQKVPVIYYLSRNGQLEHPHFMVVPLSSPQGLHLKDAISRLTSLRGQGIANMYSWSSKRSYKNSFVWQDLSEDDFIYPCQGHEYVLKGSQLLEPNPLSFRSFEGTDSSFSSSSSSMFSRETNSPGEEHVNVPPTTITRSKNQPCGSFDDLREYQVHTTKTAKELGAKSASALRQADVRAGQRRTNIAGAAEENGACFESLKGSMEVDDGCGKDRKAENACECGRTKASTALMHLIKCGSRIKDCEPIKS